MKKVILLLMVLCIAFITNAQMNAPKGIKVGKLVSGTNIMLIDSINQIYTDGIRFYKGAVQLYPYMPHSYITDWATATSAFVTGTPWTSMGYSTLTGTQTLTNKTLTSPKINENVVLIPTSTELNFVDGVTSSIQQQLDGTVKQTSLENPYPIIHAMIDSLITGTYIRGDSIYKIKYVATKIPLEVLTFTALSGTFVQSPAGTWGNGGVGVATKSLTGDGWFEIEYASNINDAAKISLSTTNTSDTYPWDYNINILDANGGYETYGLNYEDNTNTPSQIGDKVRIKRTGTVVTAEYYRSGTWTVMKTFSVASSGTLYLKSVVWESYITNPKGYNVH